MKTLAIKIALDLLGSFLRKRLGVYEEFVDDLYAFFRDTVIALVRGVPLKNAIIHALNLHKEGMVKDLLRLLQMLADEEKSEQEKEVYREVLLKISALNMKKSQDSFNAALANYAIQNPPEK